MTTQRYPAGCAARSQVRGDASSSPDASDPADYAWIVNFNNGNANIDNQDNDYFVRPVRSVAAPASEYQGAGQQGPASFKNLHTAWKAARRAKQPSGNQLRFDARWIDGLLGLEQRINTYCWQPRPTSCFVAQRPKAREIHAPDFADRIVHHWLVPQLEAISEPGFIHDSFSNRPGKGTHAAVDRLQQFVRQVHSGQGGGWYLQLDIHNFFNSIHRPTLYRQLKRRMERAGLPDATRRVVHELLRRSPLEQGVIHRSTEAERALVPPHKRLENAAPGCGIPIGNLSSQFFANVYLDALDQFAKHQLKAPRYLRYVDDFILVHHSREQLQAWQAQIERFLGAELRLSLKAEIKLQPLTSGIDFLGYIVYPTHRLVRPRVVQHARQSLAAWGAAHVRSTGLHGTPEALRQGAAIWNSYLGHLSHANAWRLQQGFLQRFPWLPALQARRRFDYRLEGRTVRISA